MCCIRRRVVIAVIVWAIAVTTGTAAMVRYQMTPAARSDSAPPRYLSTSEIKLDPARPTLIMVLHSRCPCSRASVHELSALLATTHDRLASRVVFVRPAGAADSFIRGNLWKAAAEIPGVELHVDENGRLASQLNATTSGHVFVYASDGTLLYSGGITDGRGHEGDNPGTAAILALLDSPRSAICETPVFGCTLVNTQHN